MSLATTETPARIPAIDALRGVALLGMIVYHFAWDLSFFGLAAFDLAGGAGWITLRTLVAGGFLALMGVSLSLAHRGGLRVRPFLRRLVILTLAAAAVTLATWIAIPDSFIFFGILHAIAVYSVLALPFLRLPWLLTATLAVATIAVPFFYADPAFDRWWLLPLGLAANPPPSNDFEPFFPWFGAVLIGVAAARLGLPDALAGWRGTDAPSRLLRWAGRRSLAIYLLHQPLLIGLLALFVLATGVGALPGDPRAGFAADCRWGCEGGGVAADACQRYCACLETGIAEAALWPSLSPDAGVSRDPRLGALVTTCRNDALPPG